jgi:hypothetical protein
MGLAMLASAARERDRGCQFRRTTDRSKQGDQLVHRKIGLTKNISERPTLNVTAVMRDHDEQSRPSRVFQDLMTSRRMMDGKAAPATSDSR